MAISFMTTLTSNTVSLTSSTCTCTYCHSKLGLNLAGSGKQEKTRNSPLYVAIMMQCNNNGGGGVGGGSCQYSSPPLIRPRYLPRNCARWALARREGNAFTVAEPKIAATLERVASVKCPLTEVHVTAVFVFDW